MARVVRTRQTKHRDFLALVVRSSTARRASSSGVRSVESVESNRIATWCRFIPCGPDSRVMNGHESLFGARPARVVPLGAAFPKDGCRGDAVRGSSDATRRGTSPRSARRRVRLRPWKRLDAGCVPERVSVACHRAAREHVWRLGSFVGRDVRFSRAAALPLRVFWQRSFGQNPAIQFRAKKSRSEDWSFRNPTGRRSHASHRTARAAGDVLVSEVRLTA